MVRKRVNSMDLDVVGNGGVSLVETMCGFWFVVAYWEGDGGR